MNETRERQFINKLSSFGADISLHNANCGVRASGNANNKNISGVGPPYVLRTMAKHLLTHTLFGLFGEITYEMKFYIFTVSTPTHTHTLNITAGLATK